MKPYLYALVILLSLIFSVTAASCSGPDLETVRQRFINEVMEPATDQAEVAHLMETVRADGTWPGIDYENVSNTGFQHARHLQNLVELCRAYKQEGSGFQKDPKLKGVIDRALNFWLDHDFICENWWWNQIGTPESLVRVLLIMDADLSEDQVTRLLPIVGRANMNATGARPSGDRIRIAGILGKVLLFKRDEAEFDQVVKIIEGEIKFSTERGMQYDYSFHHREDRVNNTLSYGINYAIAFAEWAAHVSGTRYQFSEGSLHLLTDYYLDGICKMMVYGKYPDPGATNRSITYPGELKADGPEIPEQLLQTGSYRKKELEEIVAIRRDEMKPTLSFSTFFWQSDHYTQQRPEYFTSVRMYSSRNCNMEDPYNSEGLKNHYRGDGANYISRTGDEYYNISPVYDWQKIPGTTIVQNPSLPSPNEIQKKGLTDFVGAVTDGRYGAVAFDFKSPHDPLEAQKAWFFFDDEYVCLGAGIQSSSLFPVATTINQCLLRGDVVLMSDNKMTVIPAGDRELNQVKWIYHDGIGYLFPEPATVNLSNQSAKGTWFSINHQASSSKEEVREDVFKLWLDHGRHPSKETYAYLVIPAVTEKEMQADKNNRNIRILVNTPEMQAVSHNGLNLTQIVFYQAGEIELPGGLKVGTDDPGIVMLKTDGKVIRKISVADPTHHLEKMHLSVSVKTDEKGDGFRSRWNEEKGVSEITIDLPQTVYAGKSVTINL